MGHLGGEWLTRTVDFVLARERLGAVLSGVMSAQREQGELPALEYDIVTAAFASARESQLREVVERLPEPDRASWTAAMAGAEEHPSVVRDVAYRLLAHPANRQLARRLLRELPPLDVECVGRSAAAINAWYAQARGDMSPVVQALQAEVGPEGTPVQAMSWLAQGHNDFRGYGVLGRHGVAAALRRPARGAPDGHGRGMWVVETTGTDHAHAFFVVNEHGRLRMIDPSRGVDGDFDPDDIDPGVRLVHGIEFEPDGTPTHPLEAHENLEVYDDPPPEDARAHRQHLPGAYVAGDGSAGDEGADGVPDPTRRVNSDYAADPRDVFSGTVRDRQQFAKDLSGMYGQHHGVAFMSYFEGEGVGGQLVLTGDILNGDTRKGEITWRFLRVRGEWVVRERIRIYSAQPLDDEFYEKTGSELERLCARCGFDRIEASGNGTSVRARQGFDWDPEKAEESMHSIETSAVRVQRLPQFSEETWWVLDIVRVQLLYPRNPPMLIDLAKLATTDNPILGDDLLEGARVHVVKHLRAGVADEAPAQPAADEVQGRVTGKGSDVPDRDPHPAESYFDGDSRPVGAERWSDVRPAAQMLTGIYGHEIPVESDDPSPVELSRAAGSYLERATFAEVGETLRYLGRDSSAILMARGNRVFLGFNIGDEVYYCDPRNGVRTRLPPEDLEMGETALAGYLDFRGNPLVPLDEYDTSFRDVQRWDEAVLAGLLPIYREALERQLAKDRAALNVEFVSAMDRGVEPGSEEANRLAERHLALERRLSMGCTHEMHRFLGRRLVTNATLRASYQSITDPVSGQQRLTPRLAVYVRDVIVANAGPHLGPPTTPLPPTRIPARQGTHHRVPTRPPASIPSHAPTSLAVRASMSGSRTRVAERVMAIPRVRVSGGLIWV